MPSPHRATPQRRRCFGITSAVLLALGGLFIALAFFLKQRSKYEHDKASAARDAHNDMYGEPDPALISELNAAVEAWNEATRPTALAALGWATPVSGWLPADVVVATALSSSSSSSSSATANLSLSEKTWGVDMCQYITGKEAGPCTAGTSPAAYTPKSFTAWQVGSAAPALLPTPEGNANPDTVVLQLSTRSAAPHHAPLAVNISIPAKRQRTVWALQCGTNPSNHNTNSGCSPADMLLGCRYLYGPLATYVGSGCTALDCGKCVYYNFITEVCLVVDPPTLAASALANKAKASSSSSSSLLPAGVRGCFGESFISMYAFNHMHGDATPYIFPLSENDVESAAMYTGAGARGDQTNTSTVANTPFSVSVRRADDPTNTLFSILGEVTGQPLGIPLIKIDNKENNAGFGEILFAILFFIIAGVLLCASLVFLLCYACGCCSASNAGPYTEVNGLEEGDSKRNFQSLASA